jgi:hypothetical protein
VGKSFINTLEKGGLKLKKLLFLVATLICMSWSQAYADFSFSFVDSTGDYSVTGTLLTTSNGNGTYTITGGSLTGTGTDDLNVAFSVLPIAPNGVSIRPFGSTDLIYDNMLTPGSNPFLTSNGLVAESSNGLSYLNIWGNSPNSYTVFQLGYNTTTQSEIYGPQNNGSANVTPTPIPAAAWLLGSGLMGLFGFRRKEKV